MQIEVARIPDEGLELEGTDESVFGSGDERGFKAVSPVSYRLSCNYVSGELIIFGQLSVEIEFPCSRCAVSFGKEIAESGFECVVEAPEGNESVDLTEDMREAILCAFPSHPLCRKACKGLCAQCGIDLNNGECGCVPASDNRWSGLNNIELE